MRSLDETADLDRICVAATFTVEPIAEAMHFWIDQLSLPAQLEFAPYNQVFQQLLHPGSELRTNSRGFNVVWLRWDDLVNATSDRDWLNGVETIMAELVAAISGAANATPIPWIVLMGPSKRPAELARLETDFKRQLANVTNIHVIDHAAIHRAYPITRWADAEGERFGHVPYTRHGFAAAATAVIRRITALRASPRKVIVLDCDNTLWAGVCGEDGTAGVRLDESFLTLQRFMVEQKHRGRLLCLASKNSEADALAVFDERDDMVLNRSDLVSWRINWSAKADNIVELAEELSLGLDSFVFVDDNPVECAEMRARRPQVLTLQLPERSDHIPALLQHVWCFDQVRVTDADKDRTQSYQRAVKREQLRTESSSLHDFLAGLDLHIDTAPVAAADIARVSQLTQRTNQFNSTTLRLDEADVRTWIASPTHTALSVRVKDRFGDYGLVGVVLAETLPTTLRVRGLMLSCRALGRGVEHHMLAQIGALAQRTGRATVELEFRKSARNLPVHSFLQSLTASQRGDAAMTIYELATTAAVAVQFNPTDTTNDDDNPTSTVAPTSTWPTTSTLIRIATELNTVDRIVTAIDANVRTRPDQDHPYMPPRSQRERAIARIWRDVLRIDLVGTRDRFTDLGGGSLQLVRVHGLLLERLDLDVDITTLFQHPTIAELVAALDQDGTSRVNQVQLRATNMRRALRTHEQLTGLAQIKEDIRG